MEDDAREKAISQRVPQPCEVPGVSLRGSRAGLDLEADDAFAPQLRQQIDLLAAAAGSQVLEAGRDLAHLCCASSNTFKPSFRTPTDRVDDRTRMGALRPDIEVVRETAPYCRLSTADAGAVVDEVGAAVAGWRDLVRRIGIAVDELKGVGAAFISV